MMSLSNAIKGLQILQKYEPENEIILWCDALRLLRPVTVSAEDAKTLDEMEWMYDSEDGWWFSDL